jgi:ATP-dependent RNA helicase RhlE
VADYLTKHGISCARIHGNRSQAQRTDALAGFKQGAYRVLVATDIAARGIDVEALSHVVNFDTPAVPEDYIHRAGRTARAEATGDAVTFVSPEEEGDFRAIERAIGSRIQRLQPVDFHPGNVEQVRPERPLAERIAEIRARKAEERARAAEKAARKAANLAAEDARRQGRSGGARPGPGAGRGPQGAPSSNGGGQGGGYAGGGGRPGGNRPNGSRPNNNGTASRGTGNAGAPLPSFRSVRGSQ